MSETSIIASEQVCGADVRRTRGGAAPVPPVLRLILGIMFAFVVALSSPAGASYADMRLGDSEIHGYTPSEMAEVDEDGPTEEKLAQLPSRVESMVVAFIRYMLPFLAIGAVCIIVYNVVANFFRAEEDKVPMSKILKDIVEGFFFILFAWIIVELIIYFLIGGEAFVEEYLL